MSSIYNYGSIAASDYGIFDYAGHIVNVYNYGTINGAAAAIDTYFDTVGHLYNYGTVDCLVDLGETGSYFVNSGSVQGAIALGAGEGELYFDRWLGQRRDCLRLGRRRGDRRQHRRSVVGGSGNDVLYANPTRTATNNAAKTTLDGATGNNWLYGDGAFTTFM